MFSRSFLSFSHVAAEPEQSVYVLAGGRNRLSAASTRRAAAGRNARLRPLF